MFMHSLWCVCTTSLHQQLIRQLYIFLVHIIKILALNGIVFIKHQSLQYHCFGIALAACILSISTGRLNLAAGFAIIFVAQAICPLLPANLSSDRQYANTGLLASQDSHSSAEKLPAYGQIRSIFSIFGSAYNSLVLGLYKEPFNRSSLPDLKNECKPAHASVSFRQRPSSDKIVKDLFWHFKVPLLLQWLSAVVVGLSNCARPLILQFLLRSLSGVSRRKEQHFQLLLVGFVGLSYVIEAAARVCQQRSSIDTACAVKGILSIAIYQKLMKKPEAKAKNDTQSEGEELDAELGRIQALLTVDVDRIATFLLLMTGLLGQATTYIVVSLFGLYAINGWTIISGLVVAAIVTAANAMLSMKNAEYFNKQRLFADQRLALATEVVQQMRFIKFCESILRQQFDSNLLIEPSQLWKTVQRTHSCD